MKTHRVVLLSLLVLALTLNAAWAQVPNINLGAGNTCTGITVAAIPNEAGTRFSYQVTVANNALFNGFDVVWVIGLSVYPNAGFATAAPINIKELAPGWQKIPYDPATNGFAFQANTEQDSIAPGQTLILGQADFEATPPNQQYLISLEYRNSEGRTQLDFCNASGVVPEPGTLALLGMGLLPLAELLSRKRPISVFIRSIY